MSIISQLPAEIYSSAHQVRHDNSLLGEYEMRIYRGVEGPVVILEAGSTSPLPMEYLSERAVIKFLEVLPISHARFFERHSRGHSEILMEVGFNDRGFQRIVCDAGDVIAAVSRADSGDQSLIGEGHVSLSRRRSA